MTARPDFDLYATLEVEKSATQEEIKNSYRKLALLHHPDKHQDSPEATAKFQQISVAYEVLKDTNKRQEHDAIEEYLRSSEGSVPFSQSGGSSLNFRRPWFNTPVSGLVEDDVERLFFKGQFASRPYGRRWYGLDTKDTSKEESDRINSRSKLVFEKEDYRGKNKSGKGETKHASPEAGGMLAHMFRQEREVRGIEPLMDHMNRAKEVKDNAVQAPEQ